MKLDRNFLIESILHEMASMSFFDKIAKKGTSLVNKEVDSIKSSIVKKKPLQENDDSQFFFDHIMDLLGREEIEFGRQGIELYQQLSVAQDGDPPEVAFSDGQKAAIEKEMA